MEGQANLMDRIANCRKAISRWRKTSDLNSHERIIRLKAAYEAEISKLHPSRVVMKSLKQQLAEAYKDEELFWRQKCREEWLRDGDCNTKFFHNVVKGRKVKNRILMLLDEYGNEHFSEGAKGEIAVEYFRDLFMSSNPFDLEDLFSDFPSRISPEMNINLTAAITMEEIRKAAMCVDGGSAPGEDGLTGSFYHKYWHIVGPVISGEIK